MKRLLFALVLATTMALAVALPTAAIPPPGTACLPNGKPFPVAQPFTTPGAGSLSDALAEAAGHFGS
jgi:hypothetical protein